MERNGDRLGKNARKAAPAKGRGAAKDLLALALVLIAVLGMLGELCGWLLPTISWFFTVSREIAFLHLPKESAPLLSPEDSFNWFGWVCMLALTVVGFALWLRRPESLRLPPEHRRKLQRFRSIRRGWWSLIILTALLVFAALDQCVVGKRALAVEYEGRWFFPAFSRAVLPGSTFGLTGAEGLAEPDYRKLKEHEGEAGKPTRVIMPLIPFDATLDATAFPTEPLPQRDGILLTPDGKEPYNGQACRLYPDGQTHLRYRFRQGKPDGHVQGWTADRSEVYGALYEHGELRKERFSGEGTLDDFLAQTDKSDIRVIHYHPAPPLTGGHLLGTNSQGADIAAYLFGGFQVNVKAAFFFLPATYGIGLSIGMLMGYFGGKFDLVTQRGIEILSQLPFLFVVMILSDLVPLEMRGMFLILCLLSAFGWMGMTYIVRTATMKEKTRDYVAAARVMGAGPLHILLRHILPNLTSIIVTLVPFSVAAVVLSLTSLDYLGFGLPETYASWGRLLNDGLSKLSSPWVVSSAFLALVVNLLLIIFIGEAIREAFDPRRHTYYE